MIYITGDTHGKHDFWKLIQFSDAHPELTKNDYLIVAGDFGGVWSPRTLESSLRPYQALPFTVLFVDGNHENFDMLYSYSVEIWNGGKVHFIKPDIIHLMRGQVFEIEGKTIFTFGGGSSTGAKTLRKVAVYARVSTHREEQENSFETQKDYFTKYVNNHPSWVMYKLYADEGVSGTRKERRKGFSQMLADAVEGKFDLIVTKSVSRFARNTVDTLISIRKLKETGVEIYFEKENIFTFDSKGEFLITLLGSLAQEESRSISESIKWGVRAAYAKGKYVIHVKTFLGYEKNKQGEYIVCEKEAVAVRLIFFLAFVGETPYTIAQLFNDLEVPKIMPQTKIWSPGTIRSILRNEKYKGDALLQKNSLRII